MCSFEEMCQIMNDNGWQREHLFMIGDRWHKNGNLIVVKSSERGIPAYYLNSEYIDEEILINN